MPMLKQVPLGMDYIRSIFKLQLNSVEQTLAVVPQLGKKLPVALTEIGSVLVYLDGLASCFWGCSKGDHRVEFLLARAVSLSYASLLLMCAGQYDEALALVRTIGEITNLMNLFGVDPQSFKDWRDLPERKRIQVFRPVKVRERLEALSIPLIVDQRRYSALSEFAVHVGPDGMPQAHGDAGNATTAPTFQLPGLFKCANELARCLALLAVHATKLVPCTKDMKTEIRTHARTLAENVGEIDVTMK